MELSNGLGGTEEPLLGEDAGSPELALGEGDGNTVRGERESVVVR